MYFVPKPDCNVFSCAYLQIKTALKSVNFIDCWLTCPSVKGSTSLSMLWWSIFFRTFWIHTFLVRCLDVNQTILIWLMMMRWTLRSDMLSTIPVVGSTLPATVTFKKSTCFNILLGSQKQDNNLCWQNIPKQEYWYSITPLYQDEKIDHWKLE